MQSLRIISHRAEEEIEEALTWIADIGKNPVTLLHCTSNYPARYEDVNMNAMVSMKKRFHLPVGYSDHTPGTEVPVMAAALGAEVIEKHVTLSKRLQGEAPATVRHHRNRCERAVRSILAVHAKPYVQMPRDQSDGLCSRNPGMIFAHLP